MYPELLEKPSILQKFTKLNIRVNNSGIKENKTLFIIYHYILSLIKNTLHKDNNYIVNYSNQETEAAIKEINDIEISAISMDISTVLQKKHSISNKYSNNKNINITDYNYQKNNNNERLEENNQIIEEANHTLALKAIESVLCKAFILDDIEKIRCQIQKIETKIKDYVILLGTQSQEPNKYYKAQQDSIYTTDQKLQILYEKMQVLKQEETILIQELNKIQD